jgi:hypothetical protein
MRDHATLDELRNAPPGTVFTERRYVTGPITLTCGLERPHPVEYRTGHLVCGGLRSKKPGSAAALAGQFEPEWHDAAQVVCPVALGPPRFDHRWRGVMVCVSRLG